MTDINQILKRLLSDPSMPVDLKWVDEMAAEYPAFYFPAALAVRRNQASPASPAPDALLSYLAVQCPDRAAIADFTDTTGAEWSDFYPKAEMPQESSTDRTIDVFINTYGHSSPQEEALLERLIFSPVPADYLGATEEPFDPSAPLSLPPELIPPAYQEKTPVAPPPFTGLQQPSAAPPPFTGLRQEPQRILTPQPPPDPAPDANTSLMESLAQFFIKKGRYERAYDIISDLSLKFPEKSVYFAEKLRFLQKKMLSQKLSQENKTKNQE